MMLIKAIVVPLVFGLSVVGFNYLGQADDKFPQPKYEALEGLVKQEYNKFIDVYVDSKKVVAVDTGTSDDVRLGITIVHFKDGVTLGGKQYDFFSGVLMVNCTDKTYWVVDAAFTEISGRVPDYPIKDDQVYKSTSASPSSKQVEMLCAMKITEHHDPKSPNARRFTI